MEAQEETKELTPQEKLQLEYNQSVGLYGHNLMQIQALEDETADKVQTLTQQNKDLADKLQKILRKAKHLANEAKSEEKV